MPSSFNKNDVLIAEPKGKGSSFSPNDIPLGDTLAGPYDGLSGDDATKTANEIFDFSTSNEIPLADTIMNWNMINVPEVVDPATSGMGTGDGRPYPLAETLFARPYLAAAEALIPGTRRGLLALADAQMTKAEFTAPGGLAEQIEKAPWYKKLPEATGFVSEKALEFKTLGFLFKAVGLSGLFNTMGKKLASRVAGSQLAKLGGKKALLKYGGWSTFRTRVLSSIAKTAPENMAFVATWHSTEAARRGEPIGPAAAKGALWGLGFSTVVPLIAEGAKAGISTKTFEKAAIKLQAKYPKLADYLAGKPEQEFIDATLASMKEEAIVSGVEVPSDVTFSKLTPQAQAIVKGLARKYKKAWVKATQQDPAAKKTWAVGVEKPAEAPKPVAKKAPVKPAEIVKKAPSKPVQPSKVVKPPAVPKKPSTPVTPELRQEAIELTKEFIHGKDEAVVKLSDEQRLSVGVEMLARKGIEVTAEDLAIKEIKDAKEEAIIEPATSIEVEQRKAGGTVPGTKPTGKLDPTDPKEALKLVGYHANYLATHEARVGVGGIFEGEYDKETDSWVTTSVEYSSEQIDTAYRTVQKSIESPMPDTELFAMPGKESKVDAIGKKMAKLSKLSQKKKGGKELPAAKKLPTAKTKKEDFVKAVFKVSPKESTRYAINGVLVEGDTIVATDGRRLFWAKGKWGKDGLYLDAASLKKGLLGKAEKKGDLNFPKWQDIVPDVSGQKPILVERLDEVLRRVQQAALVTTEESRGIVIIANKDGTLGFAASAPEVGHTEINIQPGGRILGAVNPRFFIDMLNFHATRGDSSFKLWSLSPERPLLTRSLDGKTATLTMPVSMGGEAPKAVLEAIAEFTPEKPKPGARDAGSTTIIPDIATEVSETGKRLGSTLKSGGKGAKELASRNVLRYTTHLRGLGEEGKQVAKDFDEITQRAQKRINNSNLDAKEILKGVNKENREKIAKVINERIKKPPKWIQERADKLRDVLDELLDEAKKLGVQRRVGGKKMEIAGTGKAFPQALNADGEKLLRQAGKQGSNSPDVLAVAEEMVALGKAKSVEEYVVALQHFRDEQLRGISGYLERERVILPDRFLEWDPDRVLSSLFQKNWLFIEGARQWGVDSAGLSFPKMAVQIEAVRAAHGSDEANLLDQFVKAAFGRERLSSEASRKISGAVKGYQFLTKIALSPLTIARNMLDRFNKVMSFAPLSVQLKTLAQYPPFINAFLKHSKEIEEEMIRRGAVFSNTAIGEGYQPGHLLTRLAGKAFASSELGNQVYIAQAKKNAIDANLKLLRLNPKIAKIFDKRIGKLLSPLEALSKSPTQALKRLRELGDEEMLAKIESVDNISPDLLDAILHKTVRDNAFPVVLSTKRSWWDNKPFVRMLTQFKVWGTDQVGHIWNDVIKDTVKHRDPSKMIGWIVSMAITGEIYNILRDLITGRDESLLSTLSDAERRNARDISVTILKDMVDGGAVGILADVVYGLPNLVGGPTAQTLINMGDTTAKTIWNVTQAKDALKLLAIKETPALRQTQSLLDKIDARFNQKNLTQDYYKWRRKGWEWSHDKKFSSLGDKAKEQAIKSLLGWTRRIPQERTLSYEMITRNVLVGDTDAASDFLFFLLKTADTPDKQESIERGIQTALQKSSPLGGIAEEDLGSFFKNMTSNQRQEAISLQLQWNVNAREAESQAIRKWQEWNRNK